MDRRLLAVQDRLVEQCTQTFRSVQGSMFAVTSVSDGLGQLILFNGGEPERVDTTDNLLAPSFSSISFVQRNEIRSATCSRR
jgi:hypothetical protein